jgi:hypothetical protein
LGPITSTSLQLCYRHQDYQQSAVVLQTSDLPWLMTVQIYVIITRWFVLIIISKSNIIDSNWITGACNDLLICLVHGSPGKSQHCSSSQLQTYCGESEIHPGWQRQLPSMSRGLLFIHLPFWHSTLDVLHTTVPINMHKKNKLINFIMVMC